MGYGCVCVTNAPSGLTSRRWHLACGYQPANPRVGSIVRGPLLGGAAGTKVQGCTVGIPSCFLGWRPFGGGVRGPCHWIGDLPAPGGGRGRPVWTLRPYHCPLDPPVRGMRIHASTECVGTLRVFAPVARAAATKKHIDLCNRLNKSHIVFC